MSEGVEEGLALGYLLAGAPHAAPVPWWDSHVVEERVMDLGKLGPGISAILADHSCAEEDTLLPLILDCADQEEREALNMNGVEEVLIDRLPTRYLLDFLWDSWGAPNSSSDSMLTVSVDSVQFLCLPSDIEGGHSFLIIGVVEPGEAQRAVSESVRQYLPALFDYNVWTARLPTETRNLAPDLVTAEAVREAYRAVAENSETWEELIDDLESLRTDRDRRQTSPSGLQPVTGERSEKDEGRARLFDEWFSLAYKENSRY